MFSDNGDKPNPLDRATLRSGQSNADTVGAKKLPTATESIDRRRQW